jgi:hypothetical protein
MCKIGIFAECTAFSGPMCPGKRVQKEESNICPAVWQWNCEKKLAIRARCPFFTQSQAECFPTDESGIFQRISMAQSQRSMG